jgi:hypothetical protein
MACGLDKFVRMTENEFVDPATTDGGLALLEHDEADAHEIATEYGLLELSATPGAAGTMTPNVTMAANATAAPRAEAIHRVRGLSPRLLASQRPIITPPQLRDPLTLDTSRQRVAPS